MYYPDGSAYNGHWNDGDKNGVGVYTYPNGDVYEGEWKDDQKHGKGIYTYKSTGTQFKGRISVLITEYFIRDLKEIRFFYNTTLMKISL